MGRRDPEKWRVYMRGYYAANREKITARRRAKHAADPERQRAYSRAYYAGHHERRRALQRAYATNVKAVVLDKYGGAICACCGETGLPFLTIDHIVPNGQHKRTGGGSQGGKNFYTWLRAHNYPPGFQVLCYNCNCAKRQSPECPHMSRT